MNPQKAKVHGGDVSAKRRPLLAYSTDNTAASPVHPHSAGTLSGKIEHVDNVAWAADNKRFLRYESVSNVATVLARTGALREGRAFDMARNDRETKP
jgi:hypothetical protein